MTEPGEVGRLEADLVEMLVTGEEEWLKDDRDLMVALAPYHDHARRLGADVPALFQRAAAAGPGSLREVVEIFGGRTDVTPQNFGFSVEETPDGPRYRSELGDGAEIEEELRRAGVLDEDHFD